MGAKLNSPQTVASPFCNLSPIASEALAAAHSPAIGLRASNRARFRIEPDSQGSAAQPSYPAARRTIPSVGSRQTCSSNHSSGVNPPGATLTGLVADAIHEGEQFW